MTEYVSGKLKWSWVKDMIQKYLVIVKVHTWRISKVRKEKEFICVEIGITCGVLAMKQNVLNISD